MAFAGADSGTQGWESVPEGQPHIERLGGGGLCDMLQQRPQSQYALCTATDDRQPSALHATDILLKQILSDLNALLAEPHNCCLCDFWMLQRDA